MPLHSYQVPRMSNRTSHADLGTCGSCISKNRNIFATILGILIPKTKDRNPDPDLFQQTISPPYHIRTLEPDSKSPAPQHHRPLEPQI